jgi:hypothetical protein
MSFDFPFVRLVWVRYFCYYPYLVDVVDLDALNILHLHNKNATRVYVFFQLSDGELNFKVSSVLL